MFSTCFEPEGSSSGRRLYVQLWYGTFYMHRYKQSSVGRGVFDISNTHLPTRLHIQPSS